MKLAAVLLLLAACEGKSPPATKTPMGAATCKADSDCVVSCDTRDGLCCHDPCCDKVMLRSEADAIAQYNQAHCTKPQRCPAVGSCGSTDVVTPRCQAGTCVAEKKPTFATGPCKTNDDCEVVNTDPCSECQCSTTPIVKSEEARLNDYLATVKCAPRTGGLQCKCDLMHGVCETGVCIAK